MTFRINDGPLAGTEGDKVQSRVIRDRLMKEAEGNVALKIAEGRDKDSYEVAGRGELQLAILIETMRREGFELTVGRPRVVFERDENGNVLEPIEEVIIDVDEEHSGAVVSKLSERRADMIEMRRRAAAACGSCSTPRPAASSATSRSSCPTPAAPPCSTACSTPTRRTRARSRAAAPAR